MTDREKFEVWFKKDFPVVEKEFNEGGEVARCVKSASWFAWQAALASQQPADDGWIDWSGGDMPPIMDEIVEAKFRSGATDINLCRNFYWGSDEKYPHNDIIAYRVVKP